jgi:hypothetical protein
MYGDERGAVGQPHVDNLVPVTGLKLRCSVCLALRGGVNDTGLTTLDGVSTLVQSPMVCFAVLSTNAFAALFPRLRCPAL